MTDVTETNLVRIAEYLRGARIKNVWFTKMKTGYAVEMELEDGSVFYNDYDQTQLEIPERVYDGKNNPS